MSRLFLFCTIFSLHSLFADISALYLSWYADPATTMTIQWHTPPGETDTIRLVQRDGPVAFTGTSHPFADEPIVIHTVTLQDLSPDTEYEFQIGDSFQKYRFRTAPITLDKPLKFVVGGDLYLSRHLFSKMGKTVVNQDPLFAVLGGDIAYVIDSPNVFTNNPAKQWRFFLADWTKCMQTSTGRLIPFLLIPGNHDINTKTSDLFFSLFNFPEKHLYRAVDFGSYLSLLLLDTGHLTPVAGAQTDWLKETLTKRSNWPYLFSVYHIGAYPSFYSYESKGPRIIRTHWCPLFDQYGVKAAFEHHSHAFKKTFALKGELKDPTGTIYFGDGCWGVKPRRTHSAWYLEKTGTKNHVFLVEMTSKSAWVSAIGINGQLIDKAQIPAREVAPNK